MSLSMALTKRPRGYLPHWEAEGGTYSVTFHLGDSLPANVLAKLTRERETIKVLLRSGRQLTPMESVRAHQLHRKQIQEYLDANHGECILRQAEYATIVAERLAFREGNDYELFAWVVMQSYDHLIRDEAEFTHAVEYILDNARYAGLRGWPWVYVKGR